MKKIVLFLLTTLVLFSCNNNTIKKPKKPDNLIAKNKMAAIIYDMTLINSAKGVNKKILENNGVIPEKYIFEKYNIDSLQFAQSNNYYSFQYDTYEDIYEKIRLKLENEKKMYKAVLDAEKAKRDSIAKIRKKKRDSISKLSKKKRDSIKALPQSFDFQIYKEFKNKSPSIKKDTDQ